ncbi:PREDICTED: ATP-dependent DNA helicase pfh1-like, partial [Vollenhovia emeryi]|uniref:ATP-dependent DNA helicase pfh1-like n=1 Tax=Vollenhovia emeryi TaxID=411798 RepID=UPI0005F3F86B
NYDEKKITYSTDSDDEYDEESEIKERKKQKVIRFRRYKLNQDRYNYFREQVLLFWPWKNEREDVDTQDCENIYSKNIHVIEENRNKFSVIGDLELDNALVQAQKDIDQQTIEDEEMESFGKTKIRKDEEIDIFSQTGLAKCSKNIKRSINSPPQKSKEEMMSIVCELNDEQREITMHVLHCFANGSLPIRLYISGSAGVGKSTVLKAIYQVLLNFFDDTPGEKKNSLKILLCAPSGKASFLIGGTTLHNAFALPITQYGGQMPELSADVANTIRENLFELKLIIIDEISMVGSTMFSRVDTRLRQIMGNNRSFGGVSVIVVGDLYQLPPVMDNSIYLSSKSSMLSIFSENILWNEFDFFELTEIMRQKEDKPFIEALNNLARGTMSENDIALIKSRETTEEYVPKDAIRLYGENRMVDSFNKIKINSIDGVAYDSIAKDSILGKISSKLRNKLLTALKNKKRTECGGLDYKITLKIGINYMITSNIDVEDGLVNGACGKLQKITLKPGTDEPMKIWLDFNNDRIGVGQRRPYIRYMTENNLEMCLVPLSQVSIVLNINERMGYQVVRQQFPITPAEALTIHKSQGQTYEKLCIDLRDSYRITRPMLYVALSR